MVHCVLFKICLLHYEKGARCLIYSFTIKAHCDRVVCRRHCVVINIGILNGGVSIIRIVTAVNIYFKRRDVYKRHFVILVQSFKISFVQSFNNLVLLCNC